MIAMQAWRQSLSGGKAVRGTKMACMPEHTKRSTLARSLAACFVLVFPLPLLAAEAQETGVDNQLSSGEVSVSATEPADKCLSDLRALDSQMQQDGYWLGGYGTGDPGLGYGYPLGGYGYEYGSDPHGTAAAAIRAGSGAGRPAPPQRPVP